jgi:Flp pilus assembly protein TadG
MGHSRERDRRRARGDRGAALVEFSFVMVLLFSIVFGIIHYGLILSFKQDMTRAAAEAARAGAVALPADHAHVEAEARAAADEAAKAFGGTTWSNDGCSRAGMSCSVSEGTCPGSTEKCVTVTLQYNYDGKDGASCGDPGNLGKPLYGVVPVIGGLIAPKCVSATSVARTNA